MRPDYIVMTNNPKTIKRWPDAAEAVQGGVAQVFEAVRDRIHLGHKLLTHPLAGSVKPNESPFRSVIITRRADTSVDFDSLRLIEAAISTLVKLGPGRRGQMPESVRCDYQLIDAELMNNAIESLQRQH